jgi:N-acetylglucosaminyldiphosphoundecaprenol N-acetyl-beta-D-mannosaminyltransferase
VVPRARLALQYAGDHLMTECAEQGAFYMSERQEDRSILGIRFYVGDAQGAIERVAHGGLVVVPAAPALKDLPTNRSYREALLGADLVITDSAFMVLAWRLLQGESLQRLSGLRYLRELLLRQEVRTPGSTLWVMASPESSRRNLTWLQTQGVEVPDECVYLAPVYGNQIEDQALLEKIEKLRVKHIVVTVGGGTQERLGLYLKTRLHYMPAIHCIGAAIAFLSGDQVRIPVWADRLYLGWLFRCVSSPQRYIPRYWSAFQLLPLIWKYRSQLPVSPEGISQRLEREC